MCEKIARAVVAKPEGAEEELGKEGIVFLWKSGISSHDDGSNKGVVRSGSESECDNSRLAGGESVEAL